MLYTLLNFLAWGLLLALVGGLVGWALRSLEARRDAVRTSTVDVDEVDMMRTRLADFEAVVAERDRLRMLVADMRRTQSDEDPDGFTPDDPSASSIESSGPGTLRSDMIERRAVARLEVDLGVAETVLGRRVRPDDLTVIDGIGPKIAELCSGIGVSTWAQLARTDVATLRTMLEDAGSGYKLRDPTSWPQQAGMLASGRWSDFKEFTADKSG